MSMEEYLEEMESAPRKWGIYRRRRYHLPAAQGLLHTDGNFPKRHLLTEPGRYAAPPR